MPRLEGKVAVITGSARGIGFAIAQRFAEEGATVAIFDLSPQSVNEAAAKLTQQGCQAAGFVVNVTDGEQVASALADVIKTFGQIDILVNNAGITKDNIILKMREEEWDAVLNVNLKGAFLCTQKALRYLLKRPSGAIVNIASVIGLMGNIGQANYSASKGGLIAFTKSTAKEVASRNLRVNAVAPGFIETEMTAKLPEEVVKQYASVIPMNRMGSPRDVANVCVFLASDDAAYISGQVIQVDGGLLM
jgi:3-oxoacyl-[acyl-carrier protein] reductase